MRNFILRLYEQLKQEGITNENISEHFINVYDIVHEKVIGTKFEGKQKFIMTAIIKEFNGTSKQYGNK